MAGLFLVYTLAGFFLLPWLIERNAPTAVSEAIGGEMTLTDVRFNPFTLGLTVDGTEIRDPDGDLFVGLDTLFVNLQASSLFRWAWTLDEFRLDRLQVFVERESDGDFNFSYLTESSAPEPEQPEEEGGGVPRLLVFNFALNDASISWRDEIPAETVETVLAPINIEIQEFNTLPQRPGQQAVTIVTDTQGTLTWAGELQVNPLRSAARASIEGSYFPLISAYLHDALGLDVASGTARAELDYVIERVEDGSIRATVDNIELGFDDILVTTWSVSRDDNVEILRLPEISFSDGSLRWPEQEFSLGNIELVDPTISVRRREDGSLNIVEPNQAPADEQVAVAEPAIEAEVASSGDDAEPWNVSVGEFVIGNLTFNLEDRSVSPTAEVGLDNFNLNVTNIDNQPGSQFPTRLQFDGQHGGTATLDGQVTVLPDPEIEFQLSLSGMELAAIQPYIEPIADLHLASGNVNVNGTVQHSPAQPLAFNGDASVRELSIVETDESTQIGSWDELAVETIELDLAGNTLDISEIRLEKAYGDILIGEDGSLNLGRIEKDENAGEAETVAEEPAAEEPADAAPPLVVTVGRVQINNAAADFEDRSLPLPFLAQISELTGELSTISNASQQPSNVELEGQVDESGHVRITGSLTPLEPPLNTDIKVNFENVNMPKFTSYSVPFAGQEIASGRLDLDLEYILEDSKLVGENNIVLRDFELGDKVEHPDAASLPLGLAVALLKDPEGKIDIDLPVRGDLNDPEFGYGSVVRTALTNLLLKIVTSPFALLGNLVGAEGDELESIDYLPGRSDLTPPQMEKAAKLAEALAMRPELVLQANGTVDQELDGLAIRTTRIDEAIDQAVEAGDDDTMFAERRLEALESLYEAGATEGDEALATIRLAFEPAEDAEPEAQFDSVAYAEEIRTRLIDKQSVSDQTLIALGDARAAALIDGIATANPELAPRLQSGETNVVSGEFEEDIAIEVTLATQ